MTSADGRTGVSGFGAVSDVTDPDAELGELLEFFYQCPVGLIAADVSGRVHRINPAAVALLAPIAPDDDLSDLMRLLALVAPAAAEVLATNPTRLGRLGRGQQLFASAAGDPTAEPIGVELQLVRVDPDTVTSRGVHGVVLAVRAAAEPSFTTADVLQIEMCAGHVAFALERVAAGEDVHHLTELTDREQQGLALHDQIIQNLFATGLRLERLAYELGGTEPDERVLTSIGELDAVIRQLRATLATPLPAAP